MTGVEDLLRSATREKATEIAPDSIPSLDVAGLSGGRARGRPLPVPLRFARWPRLVVPLAAAVAVVAVVALSIAVPRVLTGRDEAGGSVSPSVTGTSGTTPSYAIPPYYVALTGASSQPLLHPIGITVRSTMTGAPLATVTPPAPNESFSLVAHGADGDTFLVGVQQWRSPGATFLPMTASPVTLMLLHFDPSTRSVSFSSLPMPALSRASLQSVALSPDGSRLAVAVRSPKVLHLNVYSLTGGGLRTWSLPFTLAAQFLIYLPNGGEGASDIDPNEMSWLPDGHTLAFDLSEIGGPAGVHEWVRELNVDGPGGDLFADSRTVFALNPTSPPFLCLDALQLSADAATVTCAGYEIPSLSYSAASAKAGSTGTATPSPTAHAVTIYGFGVFSVATRNLSTVLDPTPLGDPLLVNPQLFWQSGDIMIGTLSGPVVIVTGGNEHITPWEVPSALSQQSQYGATDVAW